MRFVKTSLVLGLLPLLIAARAVAAEAEDVVRELHSALIEVANTDPLLGLEERIEILGPVVRETHDLAMMGRLTVRRYFPGWTEDERTAFLYAFERFSIATYASRFANATPDLFEISETVGQGEGRSEVRTLIRRAEAEDVAMDYLLRSSDSGFRIVNVLADGVSELSLLGSDFFELIEDGGVAALIAELERRIEEVPD